MRDLSGIAQVYNAEQLLALLKTEPEDLVIVATDDLDPSEIHDGKTLREDSSIYSIFSVKRTGVSSIFELALTVIGFQGYKHHKGEVAVIGDTNKRDSFGRKIPDSIRFLLVSAKNKSENSTLKQTEFEGIIVLSKPLAPKAKKAA